MAENNIGKITQVIGAVIDIKFTDGNLPEINSAINIKTNDGGKLVVEVAQHLGDDVDHLYSHGSYRWSCQRYGCRGDRCPNFCTGR